MHTTKSRVKPALSLVLMAVILLSWVAATPAALPPPGQPTASATSNAGELQATWHASPGAQFYLVGWANRDEMTRMTSAGREWLDAFHFTTIPSGYTGHTITGLAPGASYVVIVGAQSARFGAQDVTWSQWSGPAETAGQHGTGFCPITGLPIPPGGYLGVGDTYYWSNYELTLNSATLPESAEAVSGTVYTPGAGRKLLRLCMTHLNKSSWTIYNEPGWHSNVSTDRGIGFAVLRSADFKQIAPGETKRGCETWEVPQDARVAVYASRGGSIASDALFRIDLTR